MGVNNPELRWGSVIGCPAFRRRFNSLCADGDKLSANGVEEISSWNQSLAGKVRIERIHFCLSG